MEHHRLLQMEHRLVKMGALLRSEDPACMLVCLWEKASPKSLSHEIALFRSARSMPLRRFKLALCSKPSSAAE
jgi:hypothetical protein